MAEFKSLAEIQAHMEKNLADIMRNSMQLESYLAEKMREAVIKHVYDAYEPEFYERRGDNHRGGYGLSDQRNYAITDVSLVAGRVKLTFENLTQGDDSLAGEYISSLIEHGEGFNGKHWDDASGAWAQPRPFVANMAQEIIANPSTLIALLKSELFNAGFKVK